MDHFKVLVNVLYNHHCIEWLTIENKRAPVLILSYIYIQTHLCMHTRIRGGIWKCLQYFWKFSTDFCILWLSLAALCSCCRVTKFPIPTTNYRSQLLKFQNYMIDDDESALYALHRLLKVKNDSPKSNVLCASFYCLPVNSLLFSSSNILSVNRVYECALI